MPNTAPSITDAERLAWKQDYVEQRRLVRHGPLCRRHQDQHPDARRRWRLGRGVCAIKVFAGSSTGDLMVEDDEHLERVMRSGRRRIAYHSEDEYRLQARKPHVQVRRPAIAATWNGATRNAPSSAPAG